MSTVTDPLAGYTKEQLATALREVADQVVARLAGRWQRSDLSATASDGRPSRIDARYNEIEALIQRKRMQRRQSSTVADLRVERYGTVEQRNDQRGQD